MTWGWAALGLLFVAVAALIAQPAVELGRSDIWFLGTLGALAGWTGLSWLWSESPPRTMLELQRTVLYLGAALALLLVVRRRTIAAALGGLLAATVLLCGHALATRLTPDHFQRPASSVGFRLAGVFAYPNALGIVAVLGILIALGFVVDSQRAAVRAAAAAATIPLLLALHFSNSRGSWVSLAVGVAAALVLFPERRPVVRSWALLGVVGALAVWLASRSRPLTLWQDPLASAHDGHLLIVASVALSVAAAAISVGQTRRMIVIAVSAAALAVAVAPSTAVVLTTPARESSVAPGSPPAGTTPKDRLFSSTSNSRTEYWRVAMVDFAHHPVLGSGAGSFVREWYRSRRIKVDVQDAHSLYLETLAELGVVGLVLLLSALAVPVLAAIRVRGDPYVAGVFGAYVAFAAHAAVDWDWELPAITCAGIFCGGLLVVAARPEGNPRVGDPRWRTTQIALMLALCVFSFVALVGNRAEAAARAAAAKGDWRAAGVQAQRAVRWAPWSAQALVLAADAAGARGDTAVATSFLRRAVRKDPHDHELWRRLASVTGGKEREQAILRAAQLDPLG